MTAVKLTAAKSDLFGRKRSIILIQIIFPENHPRYHRLQCFFLNSFRQNWYRHFHILIYLCHQLTSLRRSSYATVVDFCSEYCCCLCEQISKMSTKFLRYFNNERYFMFRDHHPSLVSIHAQYVQFSKRSCTRRRNSKSSASLKDKFNLEFRRLFGCECNQNCAC